MRSRLGQVLRRQFGSLTIFNYRVYFAGQAVSLIGTWMQTTGQAWLVLQLTGSPLALGTVTTLQFLPITCFTLFGGVFADRLPKRRLLVITQSFALLQALALGLLVVTGTVELWHVYVLAFCLGLVNAFDGPVRQAFAVELVGREQVVNAVALNSSIFNLARILGPAFGGVAIGVIGMSATFFVNAGSFVAVIAAYLTMRPSEFRAVTSRARSDESVFRQIAEGVRYSVHTPPVLFLFILLVLIGAFGYNFTVVIPLVAEFVLNVGPEKFGFLTSCMGLGSLVAALALAASGRLSNTALLVAAGAFSALLAAVALSESYYLTCGLLIALGVSSILFSTTINTSLQVLVPDHLRGRVMSIFFLLFAGSTPIGGYVTGALGESFGVATALVIEAAICGVGVIAGTSYLFSHRAAIHPEPAPAVPPRPEPAGAAGGS